MWFAEQSSHDFTQGILRITESCLHGTSLSANDLYRQYLGAFQETKIHITK